MTKREKDDLISLGILAVLFIMWGPNYISFPKDKEKEWLEGALKSIRKENNVGEEIPTYEEKLTVTVTQYNPVIEQCDEDPLVTADNSKIDLGKLKRRQIRWVAVSRDLKETFKYGDIIELKVIEGDQRINGRYIVHDTMNPRFTKRIDILTAEGEKLGFWSNVEITKIEEV